MAKALILVANCSHPSGELKWFLLEDDEGHTMEFDTPEAAKEWCDDAGAGEEGPFAFSIIDTSDIKYE